MKKVFALMIVLSLSVLSLFASMLKVETKHFEIIFDEDSTLAAQKLFDNCETIYQEVSELFDFNRDIHIPVVIRSDIKIANGQFSAYPANGIIMYNRAPGISELTNSEDYILSMFRHELTHALIHNTQNGFVKKVSNIFSDELSLSAIYVYSGINEGLSIFAESNTGKGRINSPDAKALVRQSKLDDDFPDWRETTGARDTYPEGTYKYNFPALFFEYLFNTYGIEKIREFAKQLSSFGFATTRDKFSQVFGISIDLAWDDFKENLDVPQITQINTQQLVDSKSDYTDLHAIGNFLFCIDQGTGKLVRINNGKAEKLTSIVSYNSSLSTNGKTFVIPVNDMSSEKVIVKDYKMITKEEYKGFAQGCIVDNDTICLLKCNGDYSYLVTADRKTGTKKNSFCLGSNVNAAHLCTADLKVYFVLSTGGKDSIAIYDTELNTLTLAKPEQDIFIRSLSTTGNILSFSYYTASSLARYGELDTKTFNMRLQQIDISGGVNYPSLSSENDVCYIGCYSDGNLVYKTNKEALILSESESIVLEDYPQAEITKGEIYKYAAQYRPLTYFNQFTLIPLYNINNETFTLGASYISQDPAKDFTLSAAVGYDPFNKTISSNAVLKNTSTPVEFSADLHFDWKINGTAVAGLKTNAEYIQRFNTLNRLLDLRQSFDFSFVSKQGMVFTSSTFAGFQDVDILDFNRGDLVGYSIAAQFNANSKQSKEFLAEACFYIPVKYAAPELRVGFCVSNVIENYVFAKLKTNLYRLNIQKGFLDLYFNRLNFKLGVTEQYFTQRHTNRLIADLESFITATPLLGYATDCKIDLGVKVSWEAFTKNPVIFSLILNTSV